MATSTRTQKEADTGVDRLSQGAHDAVDRAAQAASSVAERFGEKSDELWEMQENWVEGAREYVREHPVAALGIALAAGYILSMIMRSRD
jgi:ElaB/YqjD/DUF883 family membrane-anchored ribosome-binding protein